MQFPDTPPITLVKVQAFVLRAPIDEPVRTSFGTMHDRPAVLVRLEDDQGAHGWGEIWCNFPAVGAEHRARLLESAVAPLLLGQTWQSPVQAFQHVSKALEVLALQTGEPGTVAQAIAGGDIAMWDLVARRAGTPLWRLFGGESRVQVYASGLSPEQPVSLALAKREQGYRAFKLKVGFGRERDLANLAALRDQLGPDAVLMADANQAWDLQTAIEVCGHLAPFGLHWIEEPLRADSSLADWASLADACPIPVAAGENMRGHAQFRQAIDSGVFRVIQPDPGKWGGFSACVPIARHAIAQGRLFCPHWLGGGVGLAAAMQLKAIVGHPGYVEVDSNPNPLRDLLAEPFLRPERGIVTLPDLPGLGVEPDLSALRDFRVGHEYGRIA